MATPSFDLRLGRGTRILCALVILAGVGAILLTWGPEAEKRAVGGIILSGGALSILIGHLLARCIRAMSSNVRILITFFLALLALGAQAGLAALLFGNADPSLWVTRLYSAGAGLFALGLFAYEHGVQLVIDMQGIRKFRRFARGPGRTLAWEEVEQVKLDDRTIAGPGGDYDELATFVVQGSRLRIAFDSNAYEFGRDCRSFILERAKDAAVEWSLRQVKEAGRVRLGPAELTREGMSFSRFAASSSKRRTPFLVHCLAVPLTLGIWLLILAITAAIRMSRGRLVIRFAHLREGALDDAFLRFETSEGRYWIPVRCIPNGIYFLELIRRITDLPTPAA